MCETSGTDMTQRQDGHYTAGSPKHRRLVLGTLKVCAESGDVGMLGKLLDEHKEMLQTSRRPKTLKRFHAFLLDGQAFESKHGMGSAMDLADPFVRQLISLDVFPAKMLQNATKVSCDPELVAPRWRNYGLKSPVTPPTP